VLHVITGLSMGGAEMALYTLLKHSGETFTHQMVVSLRGDGIVGDKIRTLGTDPHLLSFQTWREGALDFRTLVRQIRESRPALVHTWMYHANLIGGLAAKLAGGIPVIWSIHHQQLHPARNRPSTLWVARAGGWISRWLPSRVVYPSHQTQQSHAHAGYHEGNAHLIPPGVDLQIFRPDLGARREMAASLHLPPDGLFIGLVARFHPDKAHDVFLHAAKRVLEDLPNVHFLLCGEEITADNQELMAWIGDHPQRANIHLLGVRTDMPRLLAGLDALVFSSLTEAVPVSLLEAMAAGKPCVVTDAGEMANIVGPSGLVVPAGDADALAQGITRMALLDPEKRGELGRTARNIVQASYGIDRYVDRHAALYDEVLEGGET
jgi:glycosyltransferase involved in cell wall biosynthesis